MAIEAVLNVQVNTDKFDAFEKRLKDLQDYSINLGVNVNGSAKKGLADPDMAKMSGVDAMNRARRESDQLTQHITNMRKAQDAGDMQKKTALSKDADKTTKSFSDNLLKATKGLASFGVGVFQFTSSLVGMTGKLVKSILGAGGLLSGFTALGVFMGLLKNAQTINQRAFASSAVGVGANTLTGLQATYGRYGDVESQMSGIASEMANPASPASAQLGGLLGVPPDILKKMDPMERFERIQKFIYEQRSNPIFQSQEYINQLGLSNIMNAEQFRRAQFYGAEGRQDVMDIQGRYSPFWKLSKERQLEVQRFQSEREAANLGLETQLTDITAPIRSGISNVFRQLFDKALGAQGQGGWLRGKLGGMSESAGRGFDALADALGSGNWTAFWQEFRKTAIDSWNGMLKTIKEDIIPFFKDMWKGFKEAFPEVEPALDKFQAKLDEVTTVLSKLYEAIKFIVDMFSPSTYTNKETWSGYAGDVGKALDEVWSNIKESVDDLTYGGSMGRAWKEMYGQGQARKSAFSSSSYPAAGGEGWQSGSGSYGPRMGTPTIVVRTRQDPSNNTGLQYIMNYGAAYNAWPRTA